MAEGEGLTTYFKLVKMAAVRALLSRDNVLIRFQPSDQSIGRREDTISVDQDFLWLIRW